MVKPTLIVTFFFFGFVCCDSDTENFLFTLDQTEMRVDASGGEIVVTLSTNDEWTVSTPTEWISLSHLAGDGSEEITITVKKNKKYEEREAKIIFSGRDLTATLTIIQAAKEKKELTWTPMGFSYPLPKVNFTFGENNIERIYNFETYGVFVNPEVNSDIFIGGLVNRKLKAYMDIETYNGYTYLPITVSTGNVNISSFKDVIPSKETQDDIVKQILDKNPKPSASFSLNGAGVSFGSYRELHLLGTGNMGVKLDEVISGKSYMEQEMVKETGLIYSFVHTHFSIEMDLPDCIVEEEIKKEDFPEGSISYILSISFGRTGLLIVETDDDEKEVKRVVNKIIQGKSGDLSKEQNDILNALNAHHVYYDETRKLQKISGNAEMVIKSYVNQITNDLYNIYPLMITVSDYFERGYAEMTYSIVLP